MKQKIRKAVVPAAGFGTRFLPVTKSSPKEMLPIINKPVIQYVVEALEKINVPNGKELVYVDGVKRLMQKGKNVYVKPMQGVYYDCGNILGWLKTNVDFALKRDDIKDEFRKYLIEKISA